MKARPDLVYSVHYGEWGFNQLTDTRSQGQYSGSRFWAIKLKQIQGDTT